VLGADGLATFGNIQFPNGKIFRIGPVFAAGIAGNDNISRVMIGALQQSALATAQLQTYTKVQATDLARQTVQTAILQYVQRTVIIQGVQLKDQIGGEALVMLGLLGWLSDRYVRSECEFVSATTNELRGDRKRISNRAPTSAGVFGF
jgi:hypothetical protein